MSPHRRGRRLRLRPISAVAALALTLPAGLAAGSATPASADTPVTISSSAMSVQVSSSFPAVLGYTWTGSGATLGGVQTLPTTIQVNGTSYTPTVTSTAVSSSEVDYTLTVGSIGVTVNASISVSGAVLDFKVTGITESGSTKVTTLGINGSLVSVASNQTSAQLNTSRIPLTDNYAVPAVQQDKFSPLSSLTADASPQSTTFAIVNTNQLAASVWSNAIGDQAIVSYQTTSDGTNLHSGLWSGTWTYRGGDGNTVGFLPETKVALAGDNNGDGVVDWQDAAIAYRAIAPKPTGADSIKNNVISGIQWNFSSMAQNPFVRSLDDIKKTDLYTDGLGQSIELKGYEAQGHDSAHPDYAGHYNNADGGLTDLKTLVGAAGQYNTQIGVHINATEEYPSAQAFRYSDASSPGSTFVCERDCDEAINTVTDTSTGSFQSRLAALHSDVPNLSWIYVDNYYGRDWPEYTVANSINSYGWGAYTEWAGQMWPNALWYHQPNEYTNLGINSTMLRFVYNSGKDTWTTENGTGSMLMGESNTNGIGGWHTTDDWAKFVTTTFTQNLPTKYLQHFDVLKETPSQVTLSGNTYATNTSGHEQIFHNGKLVMDGGNLFVPWDPTNETKIYAFNSAGGTTTWTLPASWANQTSVQLYQLSGTGKQLVTSVPVVNGQVTLTEAANTPYVVYPTTQVGPVGADTGLSTDNIGYGTGGLVQNPEFATGDLSSWSASSTSGDTSGISVVKDSTGWDEAQIAGSNDGQVSQTVYNLQAGHTYSASAYVSVSASRQATLSVDGYGGSTMSNSITLPPPVNGDSVNELYNRTFQRLQVLFTVPTGSTQAVLHLSGAAATNGATVQWADVRVAQNDGDDLTGGGQHLLYQDFEHTDQGYEPFVPVNSNALGRTHLSETHTGYTRDTISGQFSLKHREGNPGPIYRTWPGSLNLQPDHAYRVRFDYQDDDGSAYNFQVLTENPASTLVNQALPATTSRWLESAPPSTDPKPAGWTDTLPPQYSAPSQTFDTTFTTGAASCGSPYLQMNKNNSDNRDVVIDNVTVDDLGAVTDSGTCPGAANAKVTLTPTTTMVPGRATSVTATLTNTGNQALSNASLSLAVPSGWTATPASSSATTVAAGASTSATFTVTPPAGTIPDTYAFSGKASFTVNGNSGGAATGQSTVVPSANLAATFNNTGITDSTNWANGQLDGSHHSFPADQLASQGASANSTVNFGGASFPWSGTSGAADNTTAAGQSFALSGAGDKLAFLGTATASGGASGTVTVTYTDGTTSTGTLGFPNWCCQGTTGFGAQPALHTTGDNSPTGLVNTTVSYYIYDNTVPLTVGKQIAMVTLPSQTALHIFAVAPEASSLAATFNSVGITDSTTWANGQFDGGHHSFPADQLATQGASPNSTVSFGGASFPWNGAVGTVDNVSATGQTFDYTGSGNSLSFLGTAIAGGGASGTVTVTYTDGSTSTGTLGFPNWCCGATNTFGAQPALHTAGDNWAGGLTNTSTTYYVYDNSIPLTAGKTIASVTLPNQSALHVFAIATQ